MSIPEEGVLLHRTLPDPLGLRGGTTEECLQFLFSCPGLLTIVDL